MNENGLTELTRDLRSSSLLDYNPNYTTYPVSLLSGTFDKIFALEKWDVVANFSAHKHVRSEKDGISVEALIKNNVFGIIKLLDLCTGAPPQHFFSVSTDKAANPVNIMGASKSLMETLILSKKHEFRVTTARFANVAFSNGSLLDGFNFRIQKKQPLSCPSDIRRFFVTHEQSGQICLLATFLGDSGNIFFPKLSFHEDQIYFKDIAFQYLKEKGFRPLVLLDEEEARKFTIAEDVLQYPIYIFETDTSGEKEYEEFYTCDEDVDVDTFGALGYITPSDVDIEFSEVISDFTEVFRKSSVNKASIVQVLKRFVPDFDHRETGKNLDQKM